MEKVKNRWYGRCKQEMDIFAACGCTAYCTYNQIAAVFVAHLPGLSFARPIAFARERLQQEHKRGVHLGWHNAHTSVSRTMPRLTEVRLGWRNKPIAFPMHHLLLPPLVFWRDECECVCRRGKERKKMFPFFPHSFLSYDVRKKKGCILGLMKRISKAVSVPCFCWRGFLRWEKRAKDDWRRFRHLSSDDRSAFSPQPFRATGMRTTPLLTDGRIDR